MRRRSSQPFGRSETGDLTPVRILSLTEIREEIGDCTRCKLHTQGRKQIVFGVGHPHAELMFAGEAPGRDEDAQGEPFVGRAGQLLTKIIEAIDLKREDVRKGLMIGEFHDGPPPKPGLWNPDFRPLRSPVPLLAIRHMVPTDFPFLRDDDTTVAAYLQRFGDRVPTHLREHVRAAADRLTRSGSAS